MKRDDPYVYTRGQWKHNELVWAVLAVLDITKRLGYPSLPAKGIWNMTGCNYKTLRNSLSKWVEWGWIKRYKPRYCQPFVKPMYTFGVPSNRSINILRPKYLGAFLFVTALGS